MRALSVGSLTGMLESPVARARKISTRRFWGVLPLDALATIGRNSPQPAAMIFVGATPSLVSSSRTEIARWQER